MNNTQSCIEACNKLLRGEISAVETYTQALGKFDNSNSRSILQQIKEDHQRSADTLRSHLSEMGATPDSESGAWGKFAQAVEGVATLLGKSPAVAVLIQGEEHGIDEYEEALNDPGVMTEMKIVFRDIHIPRLQKHVALLEALPT
ncbi:DUF2383 domain-containing protein [Luteolibacter yonseiensis]|uniref:DUF2383 domain-containing protein n=1 Tax=Luteolibacter yonseiensis TaxID=1144680 RepID=A0A934R6R9_9BACT|nr:DUF2383 domain-containing protein [Luteolibacter yonseiensis]MBK1817003.1 DUF2383 domain-containing protein [Luteolibacter yonseiensis]